MPGYVIAEVEVTDPAGFEEYRKQVGASLQKYGGRYVVRGGASEVLEGSRSPNRLVVLEFPDADAARRWYHSPEYGHAKSTRAGAAIGSFILVEGV